jgi:ribosomal protein S27E
VLKNALREKTIMSEVRRLCPDCEEERVFYSSASTEIHLGTKVKYRCPECGYGFVRIDDEVDTGEADVSG